MYVGAEAVRGVRAPRHRGSRVFFKVLLQYPVSVFTLGTINIVTINHNC